MCLFCKIVAGEIPSTVVYQDDVIYAFRDIAPVAPTHVLIIPKMHIDSLAETDENHINLLGHIQHAASKIAISEGIAQQGYRVVNNCRDYGGQTVNHLHYHLLGGKAMGWPPF